MPSAQLLYSVPEGVNLSLPGDSPLALLLFVVYEMAREKPDFAPEEVQRTVDGLLLAVKNEERRALLAEAGARLEGYLLAFVEMGLLRALWVSTQG